ncbi:MAG: TolC family protein, partial [Burkholderiaceae bacterium]|nr:TolC family protein [Burkholderiaceae bacterium]
ASEARAQQALLVYEQTVQLALEETEGALAQYTRNGEQTEKLEGAASNSEEAARLARIRFEAGATDFLTVLDAERSVLQARDALVQAQVGSLTSLVDVYRALGGGWVMP